MKEKGITYSYKGCFPYSAADIYCMDLYLPKDFSGNAPQNTASDSSKKKN